MGSYRKIAPLSFSTLPVRFPVGKPVHAAFRLSIFSSQLPHLTITFLPAQKRLAPQRPLMRLFSTLPVRFPVGKPVHAAFRLSIFSSHLPHLSLAFLPAQKRHAPLRPLMRLFSTLYPSFKVSRGETGTRCFSAFHLFFAFASSVTRLSTGSEKTRPAAMMLLRPRQLS